MRVSLFGSYIKNTNNIASGNGGELLGRILKSQGVEVIECYESITTLGKFFKGYIKLFFEQQNPNLRVKRP